MNAMYGFTFEFNLSLLVTLRNGGIFYRKRKYIFKPHSRTLQDNTVKQLFGLLLRRFVRKHSPFCDAEELVVGEWYYKMLFKGSKKCIVVQKFLHRDCSAFVHHYDATKHQKWQLGRTRHVKISAFLVADGPF